MKFKTKYNIGDIVRYYNEASSHYEIGRIHTIFIRFEIISGQSIKYDIEKIKIDNCYTTEEICVFECNIHKKIDKKAFEKEYAKECAREIAKGENK